MRIVKILESARLIIREVTNDDAEFILGLLNEPSFIENIGDRNVRTPEQAHEYIESRFVESYEKFGFGMWAVELKEMSAPIGICGFVRRDFLLDADLGFAFLPQFGGSGYAYESASAAMNYGARNLNFGRVLAIVSQGNARSVKLLEKLGFKYERLIETPNDTQELKLFSSSVGATSQV